MKFRLVEGKSRSAGLEQISLCWRERVKLTRQREVGLRTELGQVRYKDDGKWS